MINVWNYCCEALRESGAHCLPEAQVNGGAGWTSARQAATAQGLERVKGEKIGVEQETMMAERSELLVRAEQGVRACVRVWARGGAGWLAREL